MNISGIQKYSEDFELGKSNGEAEIIQKGNEVQATLKFTEEVENNYRINVIEKVKGTISDSKVLLKSIEVEAIQDGIEIDYLPNNFEVHLVSENMLVGSTYDCEDVCGVFVLEKRRKTEE